jgi:hypothetical protein
MISILIFDNIINYAILKIEIDILENWIALLISQSKFMFIIFIIRLSAHIFCWHKIIN